MGKVEIKIRKKILTPDNLQQYRNYPALLKKYERNKRFKRALKIFLYSIALTIFVLALVFLGMWKVLLDKKHESSSNYEYLQLRNNQQDTVKITMIQKSKNDSIHSFVLDYHVETITDYLQFPVNESYNKWSKIKLLTEKTYLVNNENIKVLKYRCDNENISSVYFYSPNIGIIFFFHSASAHLAHAKWDQKLIRTGDSEKDKILPNLIKKIESDSAFYQHDSL